MLLIIAMVDAWSKIASDRVTACCREGQVSALSPQSVVIESPMASAR